MTGEQCHLLEEIMDRGDDHGCTGEERLIFPVSGDEDENPKRFEMDIFTQARKALCERSPYDVPEDGASSSLIVTTLPTALANTLKQTDSKRRHKKSNSVVVKKSSRQGEKQRVGSIWVETEEYFRDLTLADIDELVTLSSFRSLVDKKCFSIPFVGSDPGVIGRVELDTHSSSLKREDLVKEEKNVEREQAMEIDNLQEKNVSSVLDASRSLEWLLGSKSRVLLTSERPSKKRKLLGGDAGLDKALVARPSLRVSSVCDFCCDGVLENNSNPLVVCSSCEVTVHQKCYGIQEAVGQDWLCSWCQQKKDGNEILKPCELCPKQGGALKPVHGSKENGRAVEFAHLFCSLWMPEVYVEDLSVMEPIMNLGGIKDTRRKLVCNVCKVKYGVCVRCSHGTCRASFHPICARESSHRMEVWGKYGSDNIELRAFCSKHSLGRPNSNKMAVRTERPDMRSDISCNSELQEMGLDSKSNGLVSGSCDSQSIGMGDAERSDTEEVNPTDSMNFVLLFKKLVDRGSIDMKLAASDMGITPDSLKVKLDDGNLGPELRSKIGQWLKSNAWMGTSQKNTKVKINSGAASKAEGGGNNCAEHSVPESDISDRLVKSITLPKRNKSKTKIVRDEKVVCPEVGDGMTLLDAFKADQRINEGQNNFSTVSVPSSSIGPDDLQDSLVKHSFDSKDDLAKPLSRRLSEGNGMETAVLPEQITLHSQGIPISVNPVAPSVIKTDTRSGFYIHPYIQKELTQLHVGTHLKKKVCMEGLEEESSRLEASASASVCCDHHSREPKCNSMTHKSDDELVKASEQMIFEHSPVDELEGELIYHQHRLLANAVLRKQLSEKLVVEVAKNLPQEIDVQRQLRWEAVLVNQYMCEQREVRKQGRKERKHKEAQAVLAAATAAAATSSRISSLRKDAPEEAANQDNLLKANAFNGRAGISSQLMSRAKETLSRMAVSRIPSEKQSDSVHAVPDFSREHPRSCDICRRSETIWNLILVCSSCKVAVHSDCYRSVNGSTGPWYCELCEELMSSRSSGAPSVNFWEKPSLVAECGLCGGTTGAFRKSVNAQWVHAFCAEWVFQSTYRRGQVEPVQGMETVPMEIDICCVCHRKHGACIKCSNGHCQTTFHPSCARSAGLYLTGGGKMQHKAYCEKHSSEQRVKAETQKHGVEELKNLKQYRVELERLRLLCERITKREKIKRELGCCSQELLDAKKDNVARVLVRRPVLPTEVSSESATTSLRSKADGYRSCSEAIQQSDDVTVDSSISIKHQGKISVRMDLDQKTDDSSMSENKFSQKPTGRKLVSGKSIPRRVPITSPNILEDEECSSESKKDTEMLAKELVMTSDEASIKNRRLPKGYFYVPMDRLKEEKPIDGNADSAEP